MPAFFGGNGPFADQIEGKSQPHLTRSEKPAKPELFASPMYSHSILAFQHRTIKTGPERMFEPRVNPR